MIFDLCRCSILRTRKLWRGRRNLFDWRKPLILFWTRMIGKRITGKEREGGGEGDERDSFI